MICIILKFINIKSNQHLYNLIDYITKKAETVMTFNLETNDYFSEMMHTKKFYNKYHDGLDARGKTRQGYHFICSFDKKESEKLNPFLLNMLSDEISEVLKIKERFEIVSCVHTDKDHHHIHLVFNSVSFMDGKKYQYKNKEYERWMVDALNQVLSNYELNHLKKVSEVDSLLYNEWKENQKMNSITFQKLIKHDIAEVSKKVKSFDELLRVLEKEYGYKIRKANRKHIAIKHPIANSYRRLNTLKGRFTQEKLQDYFEYKRLGFEVEPLDYILPKSKIDFSIFKEEHLSEFQKRKKQQLIQHLKIQNGLQWKDKKNVSRNELLNFQEYAESLFMTLKYHLDSNEKRTMVLKELEEKITKENNPDIKKALFTDYKKIKEMKEEHDGTTRNEFNSRRIKQ